MRQGYFPIIQPFSAIPEGKIWRAREAKRKSHSFISIRGLFCFSSQACGPYKQWQNTHMHTHTCAHTNIHTHREKLMPSSHCTILARFFNRRQVMINRQQMHNIGGRSVLVHVRDNRAVWIIKDAIWENRGLHMWNIRHAKIWSFRRFTILLCEWVLSEKYSSEHLQSMRVQDTGQLEAQSVLFLILFYKAISHLQKNVHTFWR